MHRLNKTPRVSPRGTKCIAIPIVRTIVLGCPILTQNSPKFWQGINPLNSIARTKGSKIGTKILVPIYFVGNFPVNTTLISSLYSSLVTTKNCPPYIAICSEDKMSSL